MFDKAYFDAGLDRAGTDSIKWDVCRREHGAGVLPMWVADMDYPSPPAVQEALLQRAGHPTWGYTEFADADRAAVCGFWQRRHGVAIAAEELTLLPCVVAGLKTAVLALTEKGEGVIVQSPVYGPFFESVKAAGRVLMDAPLIRRENGVYDMDLSAVEDACRRGAKLMLLCSPHNPASRAWTEAELRALLDVLNRYGVPLVSDEIHADFVYAPGTFVSVLSLQRERVITLLAASKTFNVAGLQTAFAVCGDADLRERFTRTIDATGLTSGNIFGLAATRAAYTAGDDWLDGLLAYLTENRRILREELTAEIPQAVLTPIGATYLGWIDLRCTGLSQEELERRTEAAGVIFTSGTFFGEAGRGFLRINIGCPAAHVREAVRRLAAAI